MDNPLLIFHAFMCHTNYILSYYFYAICFFQSYALPAEEFRCHICDKTFAIRANMKKHIKKIHENPDRPIKKRGPKKKALTGAEQVESAIRKEEELARKKHGLLPKVKIERINNAQIDKVKLKSFESKSKKGKSARGKRRSSSSEEYNGDYGVGLDAVKSDDELHRNDRDLGVRKSKRKSAGKNKRYTYSSEESDGVDEVGLDPVKSDVSVALNMGNNGDLEVRIQDEEARRVEKLRMDLQKTIEALETPQRPKRGRQKSASKQKWASKKNVVCSSLR